MPFRPEQAVQELSRLLEPFADPVRAEGARKYLKSTRPFLGVTVPDVRSVAKQFLRVHPELRAVDLRALAEALYATGLYEHRAVAVGILEYRLKELGAKDLPWMIALIRQSETWALVDWLAANVIGEMFVRDPSLARFLEAWAKDEDFWVRRTALLAQLVGLRSGGGDFDTFARLAAPMLPEKEFFIRKAIGWVLREVSKKRPALTYGFLAAHRDVVSGLTLREGARHLPAPMRAQLLAEKPPAGRRAKVASAKRSAGR